MKFVAMRELRNDTSKVLKNLKKEGWSSPGTASRPPRYFTLMKTCWSSWF